MSEAMTRHGGRGAWSAAALALALWTASCSDDESASTDGTGATGGTGGSTTQGGGGAGTGAMGGGGAGAQGGSGGMPTCEEDASLCMGATPVCDNGACVQCTEAEASECGGMTPWCNPATNACEACSYHAHCPDSACNVFTGECLTATPQSITDSESLTDAINGVAADGEAVFLLAPGNYNENPAPEVSNGKTIALLGDGGRPIIQGQDGGPTLDVLNGTTLLLENVNLRLNGSAVGIQAAGQVSLDGVEVTQNSGGGINATSSAELLLRNSIVAANGFSATAIDLGQGKLDVLYSSIGGTASPSAAVDCSPGHTLTIRNSIVFNRSGDSTLLGCTAATISQSAGDENLDGTANTTFTVAAGLFANLDNGDLRLTASGQTEFADVAAWQTGDPPEDIDGGARPSTDGSSDVAGAHLGP